MIVENPTKKGEGIVHGIEAKDQLTPEKEVRLSQLAQILQSAYKTKESQASLENIAGGEPLAKRFQASLMERLPGRELREEVSRKIERWKKGLDGKVYSQDEIDRYAKEEIENSAKLYMDRAPHIEMYNRQYLEDKFEGDINAIAEKTGQLTIEDFDGVAVISFDLNGLKTLNDSKGHDTGSRALEIFSKILKEGATTKWLKEQGVEVVPAHQSGDEFLLLMRGAKDLRPILEETKRRFEQETKDFEAGDLISFDEAKAYLTGLKIYEPFLRGQLEKNGVNVKGMDEATLTIEMAKLEKTISEKFKFKLGTSVGIATLGEALPRINPNDLVGKSYRQISREIIGQTIEASDEKANEHKKESKAKLAVVDPFLALLQNRNLARDEENAEARAELVLETVQLETEAEEAKIEAEETKAERDEIKKAFEKQSAEMAEMKKEMEEIRRRNVLLELNKIVK